MDSQEGEISKLLSPSIYYGACYAVGSLFSLILAACRHGIDKGQGFIFLLPKMAF